MRTSEFNEKTHGHNVKLKKVYHGWVMGHGWGSHGEHGSWTDGAEA